MNLVRALLLILVHATATAGETTDYKVGPRDVIEVQVYGEPDLSRPYEVSSSGEITVPFLGSVTVVGLSPLEIGERLATGYRDGILNNPQVSVRVGEHRSQQIEVYGAVKKPGPYFLEGPTTLLEAIGRAGWVDLQKSSNHVVLRRATGEVVALSLDAVQSGERNLTLMAGDVVSVEEGQVVYVGGEVEKAGPVAFTQGLTVMQALLRAGGPNETALLRSAYVVRAGEKLEVNLRRIAEGRESDLVMEPGDQLFLKENPL